MPSLILIIDHIRSIHNVGCMFRCADGAGFGQIWICGYSPTPDDERTNKVALGAEAVIPWQHFDTATTAIKQAQEQGYQVIALETGERAVNIFDAKTDDKPIALVVGHEVDGINPETLELCDHIWEIPMHGTKESLNVSVAAGIGMYAVAQKFLSF